MKIIHFPPAPQAAVAQEFSLSALEEGTLGSASSPSPNSPSPVAREQSEPGVCSICLSEMQSVPEEGEAKLTKIMPCQHEYHLPCITAWANSKQNPPCPLCKVPIEALDYLNAVETMVEQSAEVDEDLEAGVPRQQAVVVAGRPSYLTLSKGYALGLGAAPLFASIGAACLQDSKLNVDVSQIALNAFVGASITGVVLAARHLPTVARHLPTAAKYLPTASFILNPVIGAAILNDENIGASAASSALALGLNVALLTCCIWTKACLASLVD